MVAELRRRMGSTLLALLLLCGSVMATASAAPAYHSLTPTNSAWQTEAVDNSPVTDLGSRGLALDSADRPHIAYGGDHLYYAWNDGTSWYLTTVDPAWNVGQESSLGLDALDHLAWDNGSTGPTASYSWAEPGTYVLTATASNDCSSAQGLFTVTVFCQPVQGVLLQGPQRLVIGQEGTFYAAAQPITSSQPISFTWDNGSSGPSAGYSWPMTGTFTLTVTATNHCGTAQGSWTVEILERWPFSTYLPLVLRHH